MDEYFESAIEKCRQTVMDIYDSYIESGLAALEYNINYMEAFAPAQQPQQPQVQNTQQSGGFDLGAFIQSIVAKIQEIVNNFITSFKKMFAPHITWEDYKNSEEGSMQLNYDVVKVSEDINLQMAQGSKLISKIASMTKQDPRDVQNFCDNCANMASKWAAPVAMGAATVFCLSQIDKKAENNKNFFMNKIVNPVKQWSEKHISGKSKSDRTMNQTMTPTGKGYTVVSDETTDKIKEENWKASYFAKVQAAIATLFSKGMSVYNFTMQQVVEDQRRRHG